MTGPVTARRRRAAAVLACVVACIGLPGAPAAAQTPTVRCSDIDDGSWQGRVSWRRIDAHLLVDGSSCTLVHVGVHGDVTVTAGSHLFVRSSTVHGDVTAAGYVSLRSSGVGGDLVLDAQAEALLDMSSVRGNLTGTASQASLHRSTVVRALDLTAASLVGLHHVHVGGSATLRPGQLHVQDSTVVGDLTSTGARDGARLCRSTVHGDLRISGSGDDLDLAASWQAPCRTTVHGSAHLTDNTGDVLLGRLYVRGDLVCTGNTGPRGVVPVGTASVEGARSGQCA